MLSLGIHHTLLNLPLGNLKTTDCILSPLTTYSLYFVLLHIMKHATVFPRPYFCMNEGLLLLFYLQSTSTETLGKALPILAYRNTHLELRGGMTGVADLGPLCQFFSSIRSEFLLILKRFFTKNSALTRVFRTTLKRGLSIPLQN